MRRDTNALELETLIYTVLLKLTSSHRTDRQSSLRYYCVALATGCSFIAYHAPETLKQKFLGSILTFPPLGGSVCTTKAFSFLLRCVLKRKVSKEEHGEQPFFTFCALVTGREHLSEGRFEAAREQWRVAIASCKGPWFGKRRLLCASANAYLLDDRYREAAVLFSEAMRSALLNSDEEGLLWASLGVVHCLCKLGNHQAAEDLRAEVDSYIAAQDVVLRDRPYEFVLYTGELAHLRYSMGDYASALKHLREMYDYVQEQGLPKIFFLLKEFILAADLIHSLWEKAKEGEVSLKDKESELNNLSRRACRALYMLAVLHPFLAAPAARNYGWRLFCMNHPRCAKFYTNKAIKIAQARKLPQEEIRSLALIDQFAPSPAAAEGSARAV
jgi:tetratricopeptide (TPR) repeat protein